jgi:selenocysteine lyase/cysteine desulfurase
VYLSLIDMINWDEIRREFPATEKVAYLNSAAAGPVSRAACRAAADYYETMMRDGDVHWMRWLAERESVRSRLASLINAEPDEIAFTTNTSSGMIAIIDALEGRGGVISCDLEFPVTTIPWMQRGIEVTFVSPVAGELRVADFTNAMNAASGVIAVSHVQFSNGFRMDLEKLGSIKAEHALVVNASQAVGAFEIDVKRMRIDALCATGHKWMCAGYGSGFVYLSRALQQRSRPRSISWLSVEEPFEMRNREIRLREDAAARVELGCPHFAGVFALGASTQMILEVGTAAIQARVLTLNQLLTGRLAEIGWQVLSPLTNEGARSAETLVAAERPKRVVSQLMQRGVIVTEKPEGFRVATHFFNNEEDIDRLIAALKEL